MTFTEWLAALDAEGVARGYTGGPISKQTGEECWRDYYDAGTPPADALTEDENLGYG